MDGSQGLASDLLAPRLAVGARPARIEQIQNTLPAVQPLYASAAKPQKKFGPPA